MMYMMIYYFRLRFKLTDRRMITSTVWTDESKLLQESNLTATQPCRASFALYIPFYHRERETSQHYWVYGIRIRFLLTPRQCVTHYCTNPPHHQGLPVDQCILRQMEMPRFCTSIPSNSCSC